MATRVGQDASAAVRHTAQRHREILNEYTREFNKTKASIRATRDRADLLSSVQRDIKLVVVVVVEEEEEGEGRGRIGGWGLLGLLGWRWDTK